MTLVSLETYEAILRVLILPFWNEAGLGLGGGGWGWGWDLILTHAKNTLAKKKKKKGNRLPVRIGGRQISVLRQGTAFKENQSSFEFLKKVLVVALHSVHQ